MVSSDFRKEAREKLSGNWGKAVLSVLLVYLVSLLFNILERKFNDTGKFIISIVSIIISVPIGYGLQIVFVKIFNNEDCSSTDVLSQGFANLGRSWGLSLITLLKLIVPALLFIVSCFILVFSGAGFFFTKIFNVSHAGEVLSGVLIAGIILWFVSLIWLITKSYYYQLSTYVAIENPDMTVKESVNESRRLMQNNRGKLFLLELSFIGWAILAMLTFGIGLLWLVPYTNVAYISFYKYLLNKQSN